MHYISLIQVDQLQKEVKDVNGYLSSAKKEIEELSSSLVDVKSSNSSLHDDLLKSRETAETLRKELYGLFDFLSHICTKCLCDLSLVPFRRKNQERSIIHRLGVCPGAS